MFDNDASRLIGCRLVTLLRVSDVDEEDAGLQLILADNSSVVVTVWTDWSIRLDWLDDASLPSYFWPAEQYRQKPISLDENLPLVISSAHPSVDEVGSIMAIEMAIGSNVIVARSFSGELQVSAKPTD